ncbi:MAG: PD-(D/E)XK nuclease domain-containing protein, partial [Mediterranea sp.]|nr:PD-(D/E)XK nuclease domain-containing protein [Mediterranea sp.]
QSGYLTIKGYDPLFGSYRLGFPNREVEQGFLEYILPFYSSTNEYTSSFNVEHFIREVRAGKPEAFLTRLRAFFADTSYELAGGDLEVHYQNILFILFRLTGFYAQVEYRTSHGRVDLVVQTDHYIYVMEFKLHGTAEEAMHQIEEKEYALPFSADARQLFKIGVCFDEKTRNVGEWVIV